MEELELAMTGLNALNGLGGNGSGGVTPIQPQQVANNQPIASDEDKKDELEDGESRLKRILKTEDPVDCFAQIDSYVYKYKPEFQGTAGTNTDENFGVMAQELAENPITKAAVEVGDDGYLMLDGGRLSSINTAMISELCKKVQKLEAMVYGRR